MNRKKSQAWGLIILVLVIIIVVVYSSYASSKPKEVELTGLIGGEKIGLVEDPEVKDYLNKEYGLTLDYRKDGSFDMVKGDTSEQDYLFPSSQLALELFQQEGKSSTADDIIFNSPIVLYSRKPVVDALENEGVVYQKESVYYVDMPKLAQMMIDGTTWESIGLSELYGTVLVQTTDPNKSNSGNMFLGLLANALNNNQPVDEKTADEILPELKTIYQRIGYMQTSSADLFDQFLKQGVGAYPLIAGYENQLLEFSKEDPETYESLKDEIIILYPEPTVWSSHVYIALNEEAVKVGLEALKDPKVQEI